MDFGHADALIRRAEADARTFLDGRPRCFQDSIGRTVARAGRTQVEVR
jgi:hypothetical protein